LGTKEDDAVVELHGQKTVGEEDEGAQTVGVEDEFVVRGIVFSQGVFLDVDDGGIDGQGH
jgi:hypothetical protein